MTITHRRNRCCFSCYSMNGKDGSIPIGRSVVWRGRFAAGSYNAKSKADRYVCGACVASAAAVLAGISASLRGSLIRENRHRGV